MKFVFFFKYLNYFIQIRIFIVIHSGLEAGKRKENDDKKCGWLLVGFSSLYFLNPSRLKSDLLLFSSYIDFSISHVNSNLRNWDVFGFFAFIWMHWRPLAKKNIQNMIFKEKFHAKSTILLSEKFRKFTSNTYCTKYELKVWDFHD